MMLKTSSRKINPTWGMLAFTLKKNIGILILTVIAGLLYCPCSFMVNYVFTGEKNYGSIDLFDEFMIPVAVLAGIIVTVLNFMNFSFLYQKRSSDVFHSFPMTRTELLVSRMLAGLIMTLIPVTVCYAAFGIMSAFNTWMLNSVAQFFYGFINTFLIILVCSAFSMIFVVCAGSTFDLALSFIGGNGALLLIALIISVLLEETLIGYDDYNMQHIMMNFSPLYYCGMGISYVVEMPKYGITQRGIEFILRSIIYIVVFTTASILLYNKRKAEKGGQAYAYKFIYIFCSILAGACGGYLLGMLFAQGEFNFIFWIFATIGSILSCVVYGAITDRGFKKVKYSIINGAVSALVMPIIAVIALTGCFGFTNRVPNPKKVTSATIDYFSESIKFDDAAEVTKLHEELLVSGAVISKNSYYRSNTPTKIIYFNYNMENGAQINRKFYLAESKAADILLDLYKSPERITNITDALKESNAVFVNVGISGDKNHFNEYTSTYLTRAEVDTLLSYYLEDMQKATRETVIKGAEYTFSLEWSVSEYSNQYFVLEFSQDFEKTFEYLTSLDLPARQLAAELGQIENYK